MMRRMLLSIALVLTLAHPARAGVVEDCDRLAGDPAVALDAIPPEARQVCAAALDQDDQSPRIMHEYARTLEKAGDLASALRYYGWAAEDGYPPAVLAMTRLGQAPTGETGTAADAGPADPLVAYARAAGEGPGALAGALSRDLTFLPTGASLRQPRDVLALRRGSLADAARLLQALIAVRDPAAVTRFGICRMGPAQAEALASALAARTPSRPQSLRAALAAAQATPGLEPAVRNVIDDLARTWGAAIDDGQAEAAALTGDLATSGVTLTAETAAGQAEVWAAAPRIVVEVQGQTGWQADDAALGGVFDPSGCRDYSTAHDLPEGLVPEIHLVLTATDFAATGADARRVVLDERLPFDQSLVLAFAEGWSIAPPAARLPPGTQGYTPMILVGGKPRFGQTLVLPRAPSRPATLGGALGNVVGGLLDQADGDSQTTAEPAPDMLKRLELEVSLTGQGAPSEVQHLVLLDRADPAAKLPDLGGQYLDFLDLVSLLPLDGGARADLAIPASLGTNVSAAALAQQVQGAGLAMNGFDPLRQAIFADLQPDARAPLPEGVGLLMTHWQLMPPQQEGAAPGLALRQQMLRPREPVVEGSGGDPGAVAAAWGVASVLAERISLQMAMPAAETAAGARDAVAVWTRARQAGRSAHVVRSDAELSALSAGARDRARAALGSGQVLLSPLPDPVSAGEPDLAWWIVSPDGAVIEDQFADGGRQDMAEEGEVDTAVACRSAASYFAIGSRISRLAAAFGLVFTLAGGDAEMGKAIVNYATSVAKAEEEADKARRAVELASKACGGQSGGAP